MFSLLSPRPSRTAEPVLTEPVMPVDPAEPGGPSNDLDTLLASLTEIDLDCPWSPHPDAVELALLDAVFAIRTTYGSPTTGVRGWVAAYAEAVGAVGAAGSTCDDLARLADGEQLLGSLAEAGRLTRQRVYTGALKIEAAAAAAQALHGLPGSPRSAEDLRRLLAESYVEVRDTFCAVDGLGVETFEYFLLLLGAPGRRARAAAQVFTGGVLAREVDAAACDALLARAAEQLGLEPAQLIHAVWRWSKRG